MKYSVFLGLNYAWDVNEEIAVPSIQYEEQFLGMI